MSEKGQGHKNATYHATLIHWAMAFLACTSVCIYNEVAKIMMLPHSRTVYRKMVELITTKHNKAYCLHMNTICCISDHAYQENRTSHQGIGTVAQDSAKINSGIEHDYMTNTLKEGNKSHHSAIFLQIFQALA
jgi:hypothetical protein